MVDIQVQASFPYFTGVPSDVAVNTWSFTAPSKSGDVAANIATFLDVFYTGLKPYLSLALDTEQGRLKMYDRADPKPRTPFFDEVNDFGPAGGTAGLPEEVAVCLSFQANLASGSPPARRRGRVFLGPLNTTVNTNAGRTVVSEAFRTDVLDAYEAAWDSLTLAEVFHVVYSEADQVGRVVTRAWIDNAFDTQRSRGPLATTRSVRNGPF